jgi:hypothetical protein
MLALGALAAAGLSIAACYTEPVGYVAVSSAPYYVETYPHTYYDGHIVYWYGGRWYYPYGGHWAYYPVEPAPLYQYRTRGYVQQAPPAYGAPPVAPGPPRYRAPPAAAPGPPRYSAPPAPHHGPAPGPGFGGHYHGSPSPGGITAPRR